MRNPVAAGAFYPARHEELIAMLEKLLAEKTEYFPEAKGIIVPHAGYVFSGRVAAKTYKAILGTKKRNFLILGTDHYANGIIATSKEDWLTPLGPAKINLERASILCRENAIVSHEMALSREHSIEVQLPFLQYLFDSFTFVPLQIPTLPHEEIKDLAKIIADKNTFFIVSSDFIHYGSNYGFLPKESIYGPSKFVEDLDGKIIELIIKGDSKKFMEFIETDDLPVCGYIPIALMMEVAKMIGVKKIEKIAYDTSFSLSHDISAIVGYAGIVFV